MPTYTYRCKTCDTVFQGSALIANRNKPAECECGGVANRDVEAELAGTGKRRKWITSNERWSMSMGVPPASLAEYRKRFPNSVYNDRGDLLIKDRKDKKRQMAERGFVELDAIK